MSKKTEQKIKTLENENKELKKDIEYLNNLIKITSKDELMHNVIELKELLRLKDEELTECKMYKNEYMHLCDELHTLKIEYSKKIEGFCNSLNKL